MSLEEKNMQLSRDMLTGLKSRKAQLEADEKIFVKVSGLNEEIEKASQDREKAKEELAQAKKRRDDSKFKKAQSVAKTVDMIADKMNQVLPFGQAFFSYEEVDEKFSMSIGWRNDGKTTPYNGLSGFEKETFDAALANVLDADIIVIEADHADEENFPKLLDQLAGLDKQVIVNTWRKVDAPEPFVVMEV